MSAGNAHRGRLAPAAAAHAHLGWWAFALHRISAVALTLFLPAHFYVLARALDGDASLDRFLRWTDQPLVRASETLLVFLLGAHLAGGLRLLLVETHGWRGAWQPTLIAAAVAVAVGCGLAFALNLAPHP